MKKRMCQPFQNICPLFVCDVNIPFSFMSGLIIRTLEED